jgi:hypothetical protein
MDGKGRSALFAGGTTIWVPVDGITQLVELEPLKPEK